MKENFCLTPKGSTYTSIHLVTHILMMCVKPEREIRAFLIYSQVTRNRK